ncbi:hypothetical protein CHS0354_003447 [Potamilus streckersoni]|uniref:Transmembrane protein 267 n=1 Tax=Potamilus streckersoni TaxID=2493646 RepID=A0AAE0W063_9BIVA|nr:hypothetical protein CHS0354_003447 [Potamilus streckersoni]
MSESKAEKLIQSLIRTVSLELLLLITCLSGDHIMTLSNVKKSMWAGALVDNTTHGVVGALSWAIVIDLDLDPRKIVACLICSLFSMAVDIDHFFAAKSLKLKAALSLKNRPSFHATSPLLLVVILLWILSLFLKKIPCLKTLSLCLIIAVFSHHIRDASRHGLWLPPFGETTPLPIWLYITSTLILPLLIKVIYQNFVIV